MAENPFDALDDDPQDVLMPAPDPTLAERFWLNFEAGQRHNTVLGAIRDAGTSEQREDRRRFDARYEVFPEWQGFGEAAAAVAGQIVGTAASPENFLPIGVGHKILVGTKMAVSGLWARVFAGAVDAAVVNAGADLAIQGIEMEAGHRENFDPVQWSLSVLLGTGVGAAGGAAVRGMEIVRGRRAPGVEANPFNALDDAPQPELTVPDQAAPTEASPAGERQDVDGAAAPEQPAEAVTAAADDAAPPARAEPVEPTEASATTGTGQAAPQVEPGPQTLGEALSERATEVRGVKEQARSAAADVEPPRRSAETSGLQDDVTPALSEGTTGKDSAVSAQAEVADFLAMSQPLGGLRGQRTRALAGAVKTASENVQRVRETAEALAKALDVAATRQSRMGHKQEVKGIYKLESGVVRVRSLDDFDVLTHEYGHHVERRIKGMTALMRAHAGELRRLDYDPKAGRPEEGFAEFFRLWITNRAAAMKEAPKFAQAFEAELGKHPQIRKAIDDATSAWDAWLGAPSTVAVASTIVSGRRKGVIGRAAEALRKHGVADTIHDVLQSAYTFLFDDLSPINRAVAELKAIHFANKGRSLDINVSRDPYKLARLSRGAYAEGHMDVMYGVAPYRGLNPESPSLRDAIIEATGKPNALSRWDEAKVREFGSYLWSRRALGEWERFTAGELPNPPDKLTRADHEANVRELEAANPQFASAAAKVHAWSRALWKKKRDAGLISEEVYQEGLAIKDYVPGLRDWESSDTDMKVRGKGGGRSAKGGFVRRFRGSKRDVINPLESLAADAYETAMTIARNDVIKMIDRLALDAGPGGGAIAERIPVHEMRGMMIDPLEAVESAARNAGLSKPDIVLLRDAVESAIGDEKAAIFRPAIINERGEPIAFFRDGGDLVALRLADGNFGRQLYGALTSMSRSERNFFIELLAMPARLLRFGITTAFEFIGANFVRDQAMAAIYYGKPLRRIGRSLQGAVDDVIGSDVARAYNRVHGLSGGQEAASLGAAQVKRDLAGLKRKGWVANRLSSLRGLLTVTETAETATRLGLFRTFMDEAKKRGLDDMEAALEASWRARDYIDFDRRGSGMAAVARIIPFWNVTMQGIDKTARHMIAPVAKKVLGHPMSAGDMRALGEAYKSWARLAALTTASVSLYALMSQHEDHDEISTATRSTHWMVKWGEKWLAVPKPHEFASIINLGEAMFDAMVQKDPSAAGRWLDSLFYTLMPPSIMEGNPAIKSYFEVKTNTNFFTGAPIVPEWMLGLEPFLQYTARTSEISKQIGRAFNVSPAIIDHLIVSHTGSWGRSALSLYDMAQPDAPGFAWDDAPISRRFIKDASRGSQSVTMFWDMIGEREGRLTGKARSWRTMMEAGNASAAADFYAAQDDQAKAFIAISSMDAEVRRLHPMLRARSAVQAIGVIRRDMAAGRLVDAFGEPIEISAAARTAADDILSSLSMAIARNALVTIGEPGWAQRDIIDEDGFYSELEAISPELAQRLADAFTTDKVWRFDAVAAVWPDLKLRLLEEGGQAIVKDLVVQVEGEGPALPGTKIRRRERPVLELDEAG